MAVLHLLGTGAAVSDPARTTTMLAFEHGGSSVVVDCGGDVVQRVMACGLDPDAIEALVVTHEHPDHVAGFPLFMEKIWLLGRKRPIPVCGIPPAIAQARRALEAFDTSGWDMPQIDWREAEHRQGAPVWESERFRVTGAPGIHSVPVIGVRVEAKGAGTVAYSCDTEKSDEITLLSKGADILVHEATGDFKSHTSALGAAEVARDAGAARLVLVHLPPHPKEEELEEPRRVFGKGIEYGTDGARYDF